MLRCYLTAIILLAMLSSSVKAENAISFEVNKVEQREDDCRTYLVTENKTENHLEVLKLELVVFDSNDIIHKNLSLNLAPLSSSKKSVKAFDMKNTSCLEMNSILVNKVISCNTKDTELTNCMDLLHLSSKTSISLIK